MSRKNLILPFAAAVCFLAPAATVFAQTAAATQTPATTQTQTAKKVKTMKITVTNQTGAPVSLKAGEQQMTLAAGQSQQVKVQSGQQLVTTSDSSLGAAGRVVTGFTDGMEGSTVNVR
jgi:hypothetical protein